jgi:hypothetical protein
VASLLLGRMGKLNEDRLGLFLVERIPLVFQQAAAIRMDTGGRFNHFRVFEILAARKKLIYI